MTTPAQEKTLEALKRLTNERGGIPPTVRELADDLGVTGPTVHQSLNLLAKQGIIRKLPGARGLQII
jgi:Mn-dependent DtxR family transcriptional regulator